MLLANIVGLINPVSKITSVSTVCGNLMGIRVANLIIKVDRLLGDPCS